MKILIFFILHGYVFTINIVNIYTIMYFKKINFKFINYSKLFVVYQFKDNTMKLVYTDYHETLNQYLMNIRETVSVSFEFFPPNKKVWEVNLWNSIDQLKLFSPKFFSVTCGTSHSEVQMDTYNTVKKVKEYTGIDTVPHLTCANYTLDQLKYIAKKYWNSGIRSILALRGDVIDSKLQKNKMYAVDLVNLLKSVADFKIFVAAYPETHPESTHFKNDIKNLKKKMDAGASCAITQFFFNINHFLKFRDLCAKNNIVMDIIPGIFPIVNFKQLLKFSSMSNVNIPNWLNYLFDEVKSDFSMSKIIGASIAMDMVKVLYSEGIRNFHFYTLNRADISCALCHVLGIKSIKV